MRDDAELRIGLNEAQLGLPPPAWFHALAGGAVGRREGERMLKHGRLLAPRAAREIGLVDALEPTADALRAAAHARAAAAARDTPSEARAAVKRAARADEVACVGRVESRARSNLKSGLARLRHRYLESHPNSRALPRMRRPKYCSLAERG